jgi:hypothetical protein
VLIQPESIILTLYKNDIWNDFQSKKIVTQKAITTGQAITDELLSSSALAKLLDELNSKKWQHATTVVIFSNAYVRYLVLSWNDNIKTKAERKAYLQHSFLRHFGEKSKSWYLNTDMASYGKAALASGLNQQILDQVMAVFEQINIPLKASHPLLMLAINQALTFLRKTKQQQNFWLACIENKRVTLALVNQGEWRLVRNLPIETAATAQLTKMIQRESVIECVGRTLPILIYLDGEIQKIDISKLTQVNLSTENANSDLIQSKWVA